MDITRLPVVIQNEKYASCHVKTCFRTRTPLTTIPSVIWIGNKAARMGSIASPPSPTFVPSSVSASPISASSLCRSFSASVAASASSSARFSESSTRFTHSSSSSRALSKFSNGWIRWGSTWSSPSNSMFRI
ncbi:unnamed protein product [Pseudo-nitzschia multistriata]|uniref:Uncharacterized protein n=1 Tax=Pseudo-nitzschia multistriata TaxID=183589 RepID=A0A448ZNN9_9STRA|nr:unnamed protein product [Pseudo-nitzschia multistriata]